MKIKEIQKFQGKINGVLIESEHVFKSLIFLIDALEYHYSIDMPFSFVEDLATIMLDVEYDIDSNDFSFKDFEETILDCINKADEDINHLRLHANILNEKVFDKINTKLANFNTIYANELVTY